MGDAGAETLREETVTRLEESDSDPESGGEASRATCKERQSNRSHSQLAFMHDNVVLSHGNVCNILQWQLIPRPTALGSTAVPACPADSANPSWEIFLDLVLSLRNTYPWEELIQCCSQHTHFSSHVF